MTGGNAGAPVKMSSQIRPDGQSNLNTRQNTGRTFFFVQTDIEQTCKTLEKSYTDCAITVQFTIVLPLYTMYFRIEEDHIKC